MIRAHVIALDPTIEQSIYFARACGVARFAYNWALGEWKRQCEYKAHASGGERSLPIGGIHRQRRVPSADR
jgi:putative transposase